MLATRPVVIRTKADIQEMINSVTATIQKTRDEKVKAESIQNLEELRKALDGKISTNKYSNVRLWLIGSDLSTLD